MTLLNGSLPYVGILVAAIVEGEIAYVAACTLVAAGHLDAGAVMAAGAAGAAIGDQAYFYLFRKRLTRWVSNFPSLERKARPLAAVVSRHGSLMVLLIRFAPGLRVALTLACAYADVPPVRFSILNSATAVIWAAGLLMLVARAGPAALEGFGVGGWQAAVAIGIIVLVLFKALGAMGRRSLVRDKSSDSG
jgi:membrane protein DedA with SNARE-associated domain